MTNISIKTLDQSIKEYLKTLQRSADNCLKTIRNTGYNIEFLDGCLRHKLTCNTHRTLDIVAVSNIVVPNIDAHSVSPDGECR
ncbi:hypothetical protein SFRURICE_001200 [Spodoptera frugiperda]|nr:hypothetical protein SFRURICE_001200 [Spodoptera frugiperda]